MKTEPAAPATTRGPSRHASVADFAAAYADQNDLDYRALQGAVRDGRISVVDGV